MSTIPHNASKVTYEISKRKVRKIITMNVHMKNKSFSLKIKQKTLQSEIRYGTAYANTHSTINH